MRAYDAVSSVVAHVVNHVVKVGAYNSLIGVSPDEASGTARPRAHKFPVVIKPGTGTAIVKGVQELRRHEYFGLAHIFLTFAVRTVVHSLVSAEIALGMKDGTLLDVPFVELSIEFGVPSLFVAVAPPYHARMVHVACHHFLDEFLAVDCLVMAVPSAEFAHYVKAEAVASVVEIRVGRVVSKSHGVHVHALDKLHIGNVELLVECAAAFWPEAVAVHAAYVHLLAVDVEAVAGACLDGAEAELVLLYV